MAVRYERRVLVDDSDNELEGDGAVVPTLSQSNR
jgi:hypothetical protein